VIAQNSVSYAVYLTIASDTNLVSSGGLFADQQPVQIGWQGPLLKSQAQSPWIEVHATKHAAKPYLVGAGTRGWRNDFEIPVFMQAGSVVGSGDAFKRAWDLEYYLVHSVFFISSNYSLPILTANAPSVNMIIDGHDSDLWDVDQQNEMTLVTILTTLRYFGQG
jgi:hypothetical protein